MITTSSTIMQSHSRHIFTTILLLFVLSCGPADDGAPAGPVASVLDTAPRNVLLITLDTTRADRIGCYGHSDARTPALDRLAGSGVRFENGFAPVPLTLPSHTSLLTGTYPAVHGLRTNQAGSLGQGVATMAEVFQRNGFRTAAFVSSWVLDSTFGLDRGFDLYADDLTGDGEEEESVSQTGDRTCDTALAWLGRTSGEPFFAWVHFFDPHSPYSPPPPYDEQFSDPYDGEIAFMDSQIERLVAWLQSANILEETLVIVAGDHGEAFSEHGEILHGFFVYNTTMRVPLTFTFPAGLPEGMVIPNGVSLVDIFPTLMNLMGWAEPPGLDGSSLAPALTAAPFSRGPVYAESEYPRLAFGWAALSSLTSDEWKYIEAPTPELYNRVNDPGELNNVINLHPGEVSSLREQLLEMREAMVPRAVGEAVLDAEAQRKLESLGYVGTSGSGGDPEGDRRDPKEMLPVFLAYNEATALTRERRLGEALALLEPLALRSPESDAVHGVLGTLYLPLDRLEEAERSFRASLRSEPDNPNRLYGLGESLRRQGKSAEASRYFDRVLAVMPGFDRAHRMLCLIHGESKRYDLALEHCWHHAELNPESSDAQLNLGKMLLETGNPQEAAAALQAGLQLDPGVKPAHLLLCRALAAAGRKQELIGALRAAHQALPENSELPCTLGWMLAVAREPAPGSVEEAKQLAGKCLQAIPGNPVSHDLMAVALAADGQFDRAVAEAGRAKELADAQGNRALAQKIAARLQLYRADRRYTE
jgi:arylsulfatase A-like enzyme/tetratricopeptide (TPR) repeat protein